MVMAQRTVEALSRFNLEKLREAREQHLLRLAEKKKRARQQQRRRRLKERSESAEQLREKEAECVQLQEKLDSRAPRGGVPDAIPFPRGAPGAPAVSPPRKCHVPIRFLLCDAMRPRRRERGPSQGFLLPSIKRRGKSATRAQRNP